MRECEIKYFTYRDVLEVLPIPRLPVNKPLQVDSYTSTADISNQSMCEGEQMSNAKH